MKKTLVGALTTALVVGAASTTFAAANPFSDVPADSWAYDAVTQLASDGVIDGYPDGTFRGERNITRYEMAQMVAKAMAKTDVSAADKAMIDKLAAEFADELNNLGVRVANLERNADMVKWNGEARYTIARHNVEHTGDRDHTNALLFRLEPTAEVNSNWHVHARVDATLDAAKDQGSDGDASLQRLWAQGDYNNFTFKLGRFAPIDNDSIMDTEFTGAEVSVGKDVKFTVGGGRLHNSDDNDVIFGDEDFLGGWRANDYVYAGLGYDKNKFNIGVDYHHVGLKDKGELRDARNLDVDNVNIWAVKAGYRFDKNVGLSGYYAHSSLDDFKKYGNKVNVDNKNYSVELDYKGAEQENAGTWGTWVAYRHLGIGATPFNTFDAFSTNEKGWEVGANYSFFKNVVGEFRYGNGKEIDGFGEKEHDVHTYFGRLYFFF